MADQKLTAPLASLEWVDRNLLKANDWNPNKVSKDNLELLKQSILTNGWTLPIVVRPDYTIIAEPIMEAILGTLSGPNNKLLMCGNPTKTSGTFYDSHTADRAIYKCHTVNSEESKRTNKDNIAALARKYGRESNVFRVRVLGEFPLQEDDVFIPLSLVEQSIVTELDEAISKIAMGVDVARFGDDETVIATNIGGRIEIPAIRHGQNLMKTVGDIVVLYQVELLYEQGGTEAIMGRSEAAVAGLSESLGDYSVSASNGAQQVITTKDGIPVSSLAVMMLRRIGLMSRWAFAEFYQGR